MAEQSMFWPTTGTGDGVSGGYTDARLKTIWKAALGNGVLQYQNNLTATGTGTSTLAINTGAALVEGYLYENDSSASIATASLGSATYGLYVIANEDSSALTVSRSVAGTTVAAKSTRLALNSTTPAQPSIKIATVVTSGGSITSITAENNRLASSRVKTVGSATLCTASRTSTLSIPNAVTTDTTWSTGTNSDYVTVDTATGIFTIKEAGVYFIRYSLGWPVNATGERAAILRNSSNAAYVQSDYNLKASIFGQTASGNYVFTNSYCNTFSAGDTIKLGAYQSSGGALSLQASDTVMVIARLG